MKITSRPIAYNMSVSMQGVYLTCLILYLERFSLAQVPWWWHHENRNCMDINRASTKSAECVIIYKFIFSGKKSRRNYRTESYSRI